GMKESQAPFITRWLSCDADTLAPRCLCGHCHLPAGRYGPWRVSNAKSPRMVARATSHVIDCDHLHVHSSSSCPTQLHSTKIQHNRKASRCLATCNVCS